MKRTLLTVTLSLSAALVAAPVGATCLDRLEGHQYTCAVKNSAGGSNSVDIEFAGGTVLPFTWQCACGTTGSFKKPAFDASPSTWVCLGHDSILNISAVIQGSVGGSGEISNVTGADSIGVTYLYDCDRQ